MNILFFLTPKSEVAHLTCDLTIGQALTTMKKNGYTAVPLINAQGEYMGTVTEGDLLWFFQEGSSTAEVSALKELSICRVNRRIQLRPVYADTTMEDLVQNAMHQNFVPVIDGRNKFIGIVTRREIIRFLYDRYIRENGESPTL